MFRWVFKSKIKNETEILESYLILLIGHPLSTYATNPKKLTFLTPRYAYVRVRIKELQMLVFRKILRTYLMDGP